MNPRVTRDGKFWTVTYRGLVVGRFSVWRYAMKYAVCVAAQARRGEPTA